LIVSLTNDTVVSVTDDNDRDMLSSMNSELSCLMIWFYNNFLFINAKESNYIISMVLEVHV